MRYSEFVSTISKQPGVIRLVPLAGDTISVLRNHESSEPSNGYLPVEHAGFEEVVGCPYSFVLFFTHDLSFELQPFMNLVDSRGVVVGHDILPSQREEYESPDHIWLSDTLFFDMKKVEGRAIRCVIHSIGYHPEFLPESAEIRLCFPCTSSFSLLQERYGPDIEDPSLVLIGIEGIGPD